MPLIDPFRPLVKREATSTSFVFHYQEIFFTLHPSEKTRAKATPEGWQVWRSPRISDQAFHRFLWKLLSTSALPLMKRRILRVNAETLRLPVSKVGMRLTKSRWGSCSHNGSINLSTALLFVPEALQDYVIVHELAHLLHPNHSARFWDTVGSVMPDYRARMNELKQYRLPKV